MLESHFKGLNMNSPTILVKGQMMAQPLLISDLLEYAAAHYGDRKIISKRLEGDIYSYSYREALIRSKRLANALISLGVQEGDRVATLAWNGYRHFECYYAISGMGAICHTVNPRLFSEQIEYIIQHAQDSFLFVEACFLPLIESIAERLMSVKGIVVLIDADQMPVTSLSNVMNYEVLLSTQSEQYDWPVLDADSAACLCYTSGTTGNPKGVLYSHRSTVLHAYASRNPDALNISSDTVVMPVVPMYHVCAWGIPYIAPMSGASLVLPGDGMAGEDLYRLIEYAQVDLMLGVPTVWLGLIDYLKANNLTIPSVKTVGVGGAASPRVLVETLDKDYGVYLLPIWGMTETSPLATLGSNNKVISQLPEDERYHIQTSAGKPMFGIEIEIFDEQTNVALKHDGKTWGFLRVRGPWVLTSYYKSDKSDCFIEDQQGDIWFDTGDIATIDDASYVHIVDRAKDVVKSGGEWISSIDLENAAQGCEGVVEACVIGVKHEKWDERPLLFVVSHDRALKKEIIYEFLADKVAKWWLPDDIIFVDQLPHTATGKLQKRTLRDEYWDYLIE
ncbi:MAG: acyl-CoA synthetase (AMP-forming)/AMP-acid ligase II [Oleispira sp.]|jgi:acyl-CoA synthetase (AMP-forming)/AMP-acid ligase II